MKVLNIVVIGGEEKHFFYCKAEIDKQKVELFKIDL